MDFIKFKMIEYVVNATGNSQKFGLDTMIAIMSFIVSVFALYTTKTHLIKQDIDIINVK